MKQIIFKCMCIFMIIMIIIKMNFFEKEIKEVEMKKEDGNIVQVMRKNGNEEIELEAYVANVVACEMPASFEIEALKAQAVAVRTFVLKRNLKVDDSVASQVYKSKTELQEIWQENYEKNMAYINKAVQATKNEVALYRGEYISAMFYSHNNGKSNDASWYYQNSIPYLQSVDSPWDKKYEKAIQEKVMPLIEVKNKLGVNNVSIQSLNRYENHYVKEIQIDHKVFTGRKVRELLQLRSSDFTFKVNNEEVVIQTIGYGHGVGLSQYGAQGMAQEGYTYQEILKHYYTGIEIKAWK